MPDKKRIFVAIDLPKAMKEELSALSQEIKQEGFRFTRTESLHITLFFLGDTPLDEIAVVENKLAQIADTGSFRLQCKEIRPIKRRRKLSMLWIAFEENPAFIQLAHRVAEALTGKPADKPVAHITLARAKEGRPVHLEETSLPSVQHLDLEVKSFGLWASQLGPGGSVYHLLREFSL